jgi:hypothetical protein
MSTTGSPATVTPPTDREIHIERIVNGLNQSYAALDRVLASR